MYPESPQLAPTELSDTSVHSVESEQSSDAEHLHSDEEADMQSIESLDAENLEAQSDEDSDVNDYTCFDNGMFLQTKLMKILHDTNAPQFLFQQIIEWLGEVVQSKVNVADLIRTRAGVIHQLEKTFPFLKENCPYQI